MHIVQVYHCPVPVLRYGGMERVIEALCLGLMELGHKVTLISYKGDYSIPGLQHIYLDKWKPKEAMEKFVSLIPSDADVVHFHLPMPFKEFPFPYVITMHGNLCPDEDPEKILVPNVVFLTSEHAKRHGRKDFIFNGLDPKSIPSSNYSLKERSYYAFLGRASLKRKGLHFAKFLAKELKTELRIGGGRGLSFGNTKYLGQLNNDEKFSLLGGAKALLFPILWEEPFGLVMIEAMFCSTPVFALSRGSVPEILGQKGGEDLFLQASTVEELLHKIQHYSWPEKSEKIRQYAEAHFSHLKMCEKYLQFYESILKS